MPTRVAVSAHFEKFIRAQVPSARYNNASEVIHARLRLLEEREAQRAARFEQLRAALAAGETSGPEVLGSQAFDRLEAQYRAMAERDA